MIGIFFPITSINKTTFPVQCLSQVVVLINSCTFSKLYRQQTHENKTHHQGQILPGKNKQLFLLVEENVRNKLPLGSWISLYSQQIIFHLEGDPLFHDREHFLLGFKNHTEPHLEFKLSINNEIFIDTNTI